MAKYTQRERDGLYELTDAAQHDLSGSSYYNADLAPTKLSQRTWSTYHIAMLWTGMSICIPAFTMASALVGLGLSPWLAVFNVALGNLIIFIPMQLNSHAGTKYGIPFPVFARMTFGPIGAHLPSLSRALVACGWCAVQSWVGGQSVAAIIGVFVPSFNSNPYHFHIGFAIFLVVVLLVALRGSEGIKWMEAIGSPILLVLSAALLVWATLLVSGQGGSIGDILNASTNQGLVAEKGGFLYVFLGGLTANISFWATMALNIPDFSRYAKSQKAQFRGQVFGLPIMMAICAFVGAYFAQATQIAYGEAIFDPTQVLTKLDNPVLIIVVSLGVIIATLTTNTAANVMAPANVFSNLIPRKINYTIGVWITVILCVAFRPWYIFSDAGAYIFGWLNTYGAILAPVAAIFIADYYAVKKTKLAISELFQGSNGRYWYSSGFNIKALIAWFGGAALPVWGSFSNIAALKWIAANGYFVGFIIGFAIYVALMKGPHSSFVSDEEYASITEKVS